jgi:hypothetical protein
VHRHYGGNCQHQEECLRHRPSIILISFGKALRISEFGSDDTFAEGEVLTHTGLSQEGGTCSKRFACAEGYYLQQFGLLLPKNWQSQNSFVISNTSFGAGAQT